MNTADIAFPNIGVYFDYISKVAFNLFGRDIAWYGLFVGLAVITGTVIWCVDGKRQGFEVKYWTRFATLVVPFSVLGARLFYVLFAGVDFSDAIDYSNGGLAIFGVILVSQLGCVAYSRLTKVKSLKFMDISTLGLVAGHAIGRWGNFINREAFGSYSDGLFAMRLKVSQVSAAHINIEMSEHLEVINGVEFIQVQPLFLYESFFLFSLFIFLWSRRKQKGFDGEITAFYYIAYGIFRFFIEFQRVDALPFFGFILGASSLGALALIIIGAVLMLKYSKNEV